MSNVHEVWVGSQHKSALSFPFPVHILDPGTSQLASSYLRALKNKQTKTKLNTKLNNVFLIPPHSFPSMNE